MLEDIKYVRLGLENVEIIDINIKDIDLMIQDISEFDLTVMNSSLIKRRKECKKAFFTLLKTADKPYDEKSETTVFERLRKFNDIIDISYLDENKNEIDTIYMPWEYNTFNLAENIYQKSKIDDYGRLQILIEKGE